jgi:nucleoside-diphosphate-sugar epimerase
MEKLIQANTDNHLICRLSYVVGRGGNPNTIINYLVNCMRGGLRFDLWQHAERNFLDVDDVVQLVTQLLAHEACRGVVQIANPVSMTMPKVVEVIEAYLGLKANYTVIDKGAAQEIDTAMIEKYCDDLSRLGDEAYLSGLLQKYYSE